MNNPESRIASIEALDFVERCHFFEETDSTSTQAAALSTAAPAGLHVFWALRQAAGRGRHGREFFSAVEGGLWVSLAVPLTDIGEHFCVNRALSLAICRGVRALAPAAPLGIKWPNDIYWGDRKLCGILLESTSHVPPLIVAGFGLNVNLPRDRFPPELRPVATSLEAETGATYRLSPLLVRILREYHDISTTDSATAHREYLDGLYGVGRAVAAGGAEGVLETVLPDGRLVIRGDRDRRRIRSGSIRFLT